MLKVLADGYSLMATQDKRLYISLLIKLTAYPSRVACLFLLPLLVSTCSGGTVSDITPGTPHVLSHQEHSVTFFMFTLCIHQRI